MNMYRTCFLLLMMLLNYQIFAQSDTHRAGNWITNSDVSHVEYSNGYTMISGSFDKMGPYTGGGVLLNGTTGLYDPTMPIVDGYVNVSLPDGTGGWYIGGYFTSVKNTTIRNLAHIKSDKTIDQTWAPNPNYVVYALAMTSTTLYAGGDFKEVNLQTRNALAAFDISSGAMKDWNPNVTGTVYALAVVGNTVYAGGDFTKVGTVARLDLAAIDGTTGIATTWNPAITGTSISCMAVNTTTNALYIGGYFTKVGTQNRSSLAAVDLTTAGPTVWKTDIQVTTGSPSVYTMLLSGNVLYIGGYLQLKGLAALNLAAVNASTGASINWLPTVDSAPYALALSGTTLYVGGYFSSVNSNTRNYLAAVSTADATLLDWNPFASDGVNCLAMSGSDVFAGGYFRGVNWIYRDGFALLQDATDQPWPFAFNLNGGQVNTMRIQGTTLYIGGNFSSINKSVRRNLAAIDLTTGLPLAWAPGAIYTTATSNPAVVNSIKIKDNLLYVGGRFGTINNAGVNTARINFTAVDLSSGAPSTLNINVGSTNFDIINSLDIADNIVYAAGAFAQVGTQTRHNLAAIDVSVATGNILPWAPVSNGEVAKIRVAPSAAYVVGDFANGIGGSIRATRIAALNLTTGLATPWNPPLKDGYATDVDITSSDVYVGGYYDSIALEPRYGGLASFSLSTGLLNSWNPDLGGNSDGIASVYSIATSANRIHVGGGFNSVGNESRTYYAEYDLCPDGFNLVPTGSVLSAPSATSYQWYKNGTAIPGATGQTLEISFLENGTYYVVITQNGCTGRSNDYVYLITGQVKGEPSLIKIFPNPVKEEMFMEVPQQATLTMLDVMGRNVKNSTLVAGELNRIETHDLNTGTYILIVRTGNATNYFKILKTH